MIQTEPGISCRIIRIEFDRLLKIIADLLVARSKKIPPVITPLQIKLMRLGVFGGMGRNRASFRSGELGLKGLGNLGGDIAFDRENIGQLAIISLRPKMRVGPASMS